MTYLGFMYGVGVGIINLLYTRVQFYSDPLTSFRFHEMSTPGDEKRRSQNLDPTLKIGSNVRWAEKFLIQNFLKEGSNS